MEKRTRYSQNFLRDPRLVKSLLSKTNITKNDTVYDIGGGKGIIASALAKKCLAVISVEIDSQLVTTLRQNLQHQHNVLVYEADFLNMPLPQTPYKVFANIPFNLSAGILHKLTDTPYPPATSYLIVQKEFADKLIPKTNGRNSQMAILLGVQFAVRVLERLHPGSFYPRPSVAAVLIEIAARPACLVAHERLPLFRDFIAYAYNAYTPSVAVSFSRLFTAQEFTGIAGALEIAADAKPTQLNLQQWLALFAYAMQKRPILESLVGGYENAVEQRHGKRTKVHRTAYGHRRSSYPAS